MPTESRKFEYQEHDRERAIRNVLGILRVPMMLLSHGDREVAYELVRFHKIEVMELLDLAVSLARNI